jgi:hypothetical protein
MMATKPTKTSKAKPGHGNTRKHTEYKACHILRLPCVSVAEMGFPDTASFVGSVNFVAIDQKATN